MKLFCHVERSRDISKYFLRNSERFLGPSRTGIFARNDKKELRAAHVGAGAGIDLDRFAFFDEERDVNGFTGLKFRRLVTLLAVSPRTPSADSITFRLTDAGNSTCTAFPSA